MNAARSVLRHVAGRPGMSALVILILGLGIGATTAVFSLTDAVLFRSLPVAEPDRVVRIFRADEAGRPNNNLPFPSVADLRDHATSFSHVVAYQDWAPFNMTVPGSEPARISGAVVTGEYFSLFGIQPLLGRALTPADDTERGAHPVVVLSERTWRTHLSADPEAIGQTILINTHPFEVIGVMPARFGGADAQPSVDAWVPMAMMEQATPFERWEFLTDRNVTWLDGVARLAPGVSLEAAQAEVDAIVAGVVEQEGIPLERVRLALMPAAQAAIDPYGFNGSERNAYLLLGVTLTLLLIAMTNAASLLLVRTEERARELALRLGIGATRGRILRMLLGEALVFALVGAALGCWFAWLAMSAAIEPLGALMSGTPRDISMVFHWRVLVVAVLLSVLSALAGVLSPAARVLRLDVNTTLKQGAARDAKRGARLRSVLVVGQVMLSAGLLMVALLLVRSFWHTAVIDPGFDPRGSVTATVDLLRQGYTPEQARDAQNAILDRLAEHPAVDSATFARIVPVRSGGMRSTFTVDGAEQTPGMPTDINYVSPSYFETMRIPLLQGRGLEPGDRAETARAVVVNRAFVERFLGDGDPLQRSLTMLGGDWQIVGIVADSKLRSLRESPLPAAYFSLNQRPDPQSAIIVRGRTDDPWMLLPVVREAIHAADPELPLFGARTLQDQVGNSYAEASVMAWLLSAFAGLAVLLSGAGLYGLLAWQVRSRTREIGIRLALGASMRAIRAQFLHRGMALVAVGVPLGVIAAIWVARLLEALLFGVSAVDPMTLVSVAVGFLVLGLAATWGPARRSSRVDPMQALRDE